MKLLFVIENPKDEADNKTGQALVQVLEAKMKRFCVIGVKETQKPEDDIHFRWRGGSPKN